jgi:hypothetical protein
LVVGEREHPAAKAGRFVRAAGLAGRAAAREYDRSSPPRPSPAPAAIAAPPPPAADPDGIIGRIVFGCFVLALIAAILVGVKVDTLIPAGSARLGFRLVAAAILLLEAYLLTSNWGRANERLGQRLLRRVWGPRGAATRREKTFARLVRESLIVVGIAFLAAAAFELVSATIGT